MLPVTSSQTFCSVIQSAATAAGRSVMLSGDCSANRSSAATNALRLLVDVDDAMISMNASLPKSKRWRPAATKVQGNCRAG